MNNVTLKANLPVNACTVALGEKYGSALDSALRARGLSPLYVPDNPYVDERLSGHADLSVLHIGGNRLVLAPFLKNTHFSDELKELGYDILYPEIKMGREYPADAMLNICVCGNLVFHNPKTADRSCVELLSSAGLEGLEVKQGYTKCSICVVDESSIITSDRGVHSAALKAGSDSLLISDGNIELEGFPYGFIGGSSFKVSAGKLAFTGLINAHPDAEKILDFLKSREIEPVFLTDSTIFDIGSILPLTEK